MLLLLYCFVCPTLFTLTTTNVAVITSLGFGSFASFSQEDFIVISHLNRSVQLLDFWTLSFASCQIAPSPIASQAPDSIHYHHSRET